MSKSSSIKIPNSFERNLLKEKLLNCDEAISGCTASVTDVVNQYVEWRVDVKINNNDKVAIIAYTSGSISFQGDGESYNFSLDCTKKLIGVKNNSSLNAENFNFSNKNDSFQKINKDEFDFNDCNISFGFDEAGKGEFLGPLVLAGCHVKNGRDEILMNAGVRDSKKIADKKIVELEPLIKENCIYFVDKITPPQLNQKWCLYKNISKLMSIEYANTIVKILEVYSTFSSADYAINKKNIKNKEKICLIIDQFTKLKWRIEQDVKTLLNENKQKNIEKYEIEIVQEERAEKYMPVACASVLARAEYLRWIKEVEDKYSKLEKKEFKLLRGYNGIKEFSLNFIDQYGIEEFNLIAKDFFKTYKEIFKEIN